MACALALLASGCTGLVSDFSQPVAIEFVTSQGAALSVEEQDTLVVGVRVRDAAGDTVPGAPVRVVSLTPDTLGVDSARHFGLIGLRAGPGRVIAISGSLQSSPLAVTVQAAADSLVAAGPTVDTVLAGDSVSAPLVVALLDFHTTRGDTVGLASRPVSFALTLPVFDSLPAATATLGNDSLSAVVVTTFGPPAGSASVVARQPGTGSRPDSVVVQASATRANGTTVPGSPVRFVIHFQ